MCVRVRVRLRLRLRLRVRVRVRARVRVRVFNDERNSTNESLQLIFCKKATFFEVTSYKSEIG